MRQAAEAEVAAAEARVEAEKVRSQQIENRLLQEIDAQRQELKKREAAADKAQERALARERELARIIHEAARAVDFSA